MHLVSPEELSGLITARLKQQPTVLEMCIRDRYHKFDGSPVPCRCYALTREHYLERKESF